MLIKINKQDTKNIRKLLSDYSNSNLNAIIDKMVFHNIYNKIKSQYKSNKHIQNIDISYQDCKIIEAIIYDRINIINQVKRNLAKRIPHDILQNTTYKEPLQKTLDHLYSNTKKIDVKKEMKLKSQLHTFLVKHPEIVNKIRKES